MAADGLILASTKLENFSPETIDMNSIKLLNNQGHLVYDGIRLKWTNDLCSLRTFAENVVGLTGIRTSPGGKAKQFINLSSDFIMTWYPGKQNSLTFNGKKGKSFKEFLVSVLDTNCVIKQTNTTSDSLIQTAIKMSVEGEHIVGNGRVFADMAPLTHNCSYNTQAKDMGFESIADTSSLEELEDFIDSAYYIANVAATPNFAQTASFSTPFQQRADDIPTIAEAQLLTFKEKIESQIEKLLTKVSEQNYIINTNKQELCRLGNENLNLKSRITDLEEKMMIKDSASITFSSPSKSSLQDKKSFNSPDNVNPQHDGSTKINHPSGALSTPVNVDNLPAEESFPTVIIEIKNNALLSTQQSKTTINSFKKDYSLSLNREPFQAKNVLNYLPLCEDLSIIEDVSANLTFDENELDQREQDLSDGCKHFKQRGKQGICRNCDRSYAKTVLSLDALNPDQVNPRSDRSISESNLKHPPFPHLPAPRPPSLRHGQVTNPLGFRRHHCSRYPFLKRCRVIPSYRTAHRHHSLEWLAHLHTVACLTSQQQTI